MRITLQRVERSIDYIESHLSEPFALDDVAKAAGLSRYHLHRVFSGAFGDTLKGYVRKRRLTEACAALRDSDRGILEVALNAGFGSQEAFTRAFAAHFGVTPGRYRKDPSSRQRPGLPAQTPASIRHRYRGVTHDPRMQTLPRARTVRGPGRGVDFEHGAVVNELWQRFLPRVEARADTVVYGVTQAEHPAVEQSDDQCLAYIAGVAEPSRASFDDHDLTVVIPPGPYAVFEHRGSLAHILDTVGYVWASWLPRADVDKSARPDFERIPLEQLNSPSPCIELWVSVEDG